MTRDSSAPSLPAAALFDWDGTIVDTLPLIYRANVVVLGELGIPLSRAWFRERYTPDWRASYRELGVPEDRWDAVAPRWSEEMQAGRPRALPWARGALRRLARHGVRLGLVTASTRGVVEPNLRRLNLEGVFETAYFSDDVGERQATPGGAAARACRPGVAPADAVYVGDTTIDHGDGVGRRDAVRGGRGHDERGGVPGGGRRAGVAGRRRVGGRPARPGRDRVRRRAAGVAVGRDVDHGVERPRDLAVPIGGQRGPHPRQQRLARTARDEHAVPEPEPRLVGAVQPVELVRDASPLGRRGGLGRIPAVALLGVRERRHDGGRRPEPRMRVDQLDLLVLRHRVRDRPGAVEHRPGTAEGPRVHEPRQEPRRALEQRRERRRA